MVSTYEAASVETRADRQIRSIAFTGLAGLLGAVVYMALKRPSVHGDSAGLVHGAKVIVDCVKHGHFTNCDAYAASRPTGVLVHPFPLLQYLPSVVLRGLGATTEATLHVLVALNAVALIAILGLAWYTLQRFTSALWPPLVTVVLLASPLLWYGHVALGEELTAAVVLAAVVAVLVDVRPAVLAPLVVVACITKETNPPFVFGLLVICLLARTNPIDPTRRRRLVAIVVGTVVGIGLNAGFNVFRYGTWRNTNYMRSALYAPNAGVVSRIFAAEWFSPNGGLAWWWPLAPVLVFSLAVVAYRRGGPMHWRRFAVPLVAALFVGQVLLLATWWAPFGWYAWGPRLVLPLIPSMIVAACVLAAPSASTAVARFLTSRWLWPVALIATVIALPQSVAMFRGKVISEFFAHPVCTNASLMHAQARYYQCLEKAAWTKRPWMLQIGMRGVGSPRGVLVVIAFVAAIGAFLVLARRAARAELAPVVDPPSERAVPAYPGA